jgi:uncharacterized membrane protein YfcA
MIESLHAAEFLLPILVGVVAFFYSGVGHGGASGYIAVMILLGLAPATIRTQALILNCMVSALSFFAFHRAVGLDKKVFITLCLVSIPASFLGGTIRLPDHTFQLILGLALLFPVYRLIVVPGESFDELPERKPTVAILLSAGTFIGLLSGMIGIGGGILLSPLFLMMGWSRPKPVAALSALFILVNSLSGLFAQAMMSGSAIFSEFSISLVLPALVGGVMGSIFGSSKLNSIQLKRMLGLVILIASFKLIFS